MGALSPKGRYATPVARYGRLLGAVTLALVVSHASAFAQVVASADLPRVWITADGGYQGATERVTEQVAFRLHAEDSSFDATYAVNPGPLVHLRGTVRVWRRLGTAVAFARYRERGEATVTARLPHPFFFDRMRQVDGSVAGFLREEVAWYLEAVWLVPLGDHGVVQLFGGPSYVEVRQDLAERVEFTEAYPYDTATFTGLRKLRRKGRGPGFSAGIDGSYFFTRTLGIGTTVRVGRVTVDLPSADGDRVAVSGGGVQAAGGLRLRF